MSVAEDGVDLEQTLRDRFALERFRPGQREVIRSVLDRRDVLCVMPTGGGKSLCYQLPALLLPGLTLVVSPLIALMKDQVDALTARGVRATLINSTLDPAEQRARLAEIEQGRYDLAYVAPERFRSPRFVELMVRIKPALLAIDEAHCISEWGHDFRPDYAQLGRARRALGMPPCIALTATATDLVRRDIADQLDLKDPAQFVTGFDRPNLSYAVIAARKDADKLAALAEVLDRNPGPAIVYASSRARCESVGEFLERELRRDAVVYHAGLGRDERQSAQERFMSGRAEVVVATNAFGMGVDKADVRSVVHYNMPGTLEAYYQEAGRAGRDGRPAECVLLYAPGDRFLQEMFIENEYPPRDAIFRVYDTLRRIDADPIELTHAEIKEQAGVEANESAVGTCLKILEGAGAIERFRPRENMAIVRINAEADEPSLVDRLSPQAHVQRLVLTGLEGLVNRRFGETVYFLPDELAAALGLDRVALGRAIRQIAADLPVDYVPPFRGNATRVIDRDRKPREITIDFAALDARKRLEYDKLDRMIRYAQATQCRRTYILGYFGDPSAGSCGRCDNCGTSEPKAGSTALAAIDTPGGREVLMKALSGVARARGRFGKTVVAQMLTGSASEKMDRWGLKKLSTFGILAEFRQPEVMALLDALTAAGLVEAQEVDRFRPTVHLTARGREWLRDQDPQSLPLDLPAELALKVRNGGLERIARRGGAAPAGEPSDRTFEPAAEPSPAEPEPNGLAGDPLWESLKALRTEWAREVKQPAYCIFSNATLEALVRERPASPQALAGIKGLGPARLERYGTQILAAIREAAESPALPAPAMARNPAPVPAAPRPRPAFEAVPERAVSGDPSPEPPAPPNSRPAAAPGPGPANAAYVPTEEWTYRLLAKGFNLQESAAIRGIEPTIIIRHATWAARAGKPVPLEAFLDAQTLARWDAWRREQGEDPPPESGEMPGLWALYLAGRAGT